MASRVTFNSTIGYMAVQKKRVTHAARQSSKSSKDSDPVSIARIAKNSGRADACYTAEGVYGYPPSAVFQVCVK